ncbi:predicted protein [Uncinocarpus reesii 1704]|uniref:Uncharacterized protein n=1 Tax=Uncinocarpus reesii (strain UAMH 1704) TaxID=336963 RepID=C4JVQ5_UNCRE|nr:uncharacterized protein UREG_06647 [Uncinocarpus reesii 1704]EEP81782.1 predicted protein [Uncinocarpus reesii 1704]
MPTVPVDMLRISNVANTPTIDGDEVPAEPDEPPDHRGSLSRPCLAGNRSLTVPSPIYAKTKTIGVGGHKKESLLTRALLSSPELSPVDPLAANLPSIGDLTGLTTSSALSNRSVPSTAELTSDSETTSPFRSNTPSPPPQYNRLPHIGSHIRKPVDTRELQLEANLGRKRCITFACGRRLTEDDNKVSSEPIKEVAKAEPFKRKSALTFVCPARPADSDGNDQRECVSTRKVVPGARVSRSPAPSLLRKATQASVHPLQQAKLQSQTAPEKSPSIIQVKTTSPLELSDAVRYHEFGSESDDDDWINQTTEYGQKLTMNDCMRKEIAIRKLGEEAEEEARQDEEDAENDEEDEDDADEDEDDDDGDGDDGDDGSTVQDDESDGNESDNEAGFASSDDESDDSGEHGFWTPKVASGETSEPHALRRTAGRRDSTTSVESYTQTLTPVAARSRKPSTKPLKFPKFRPGTPTLPDSTDFVCGTLDEDRPMEAAYISCMEERRRSKHIPIPQDIDPSFPTSDLEDEDDDGDDEEQGTGNSEARSVTSVGAQAKASGLFKGFDDELLRGRPKGPARHTTPNHSPKRLQSPPPRRLFARSPKRLRSPPPSGRLRSPPPTRRTSVTQGAPTGAQRVHFTGLAQRPHRTRTSSLPRTPNPFFARFSHRQTSRMSSTSPVRAPRRRNKHTRGPIDIVAGLEKKREKRKEKFWRQHCRKAAKEQLERKRPLYGKGAERMRELGLEVAERFKAYNVVNGPPLVLSV